MKIREDLVNVIPEIQTGPGILIPGDLVDVDNPKRTLRMVLSTWVNKDALYSLDETVGTIVTVASAIFAISAVLFESLRFQLGWLSAVTLLCFWGTYRIAKTKHSIELRFGIISSFFVFMLYSAISLLQLTYMVVSGPLTENLRYLLLLPFGFVIGVLILSWQLDYLRKPLQKIWNKITLESYRLNLRAYTIDDSLRRGVGEGALYLYSESIFYGLFCNSIALVGLYQPFNSIFAIIPVLFGLLTLISFYRVMGQKSYEMRLKNIASTRKEYLKQSAHWRNP